MNSTATLHLSFCLFQGRKVVGVAGAAVEMCWCSVGELDMVHTVKAYRATSRTLAISLVDRHCLVEALTAAA